MAAETPGYDSFRKSISERLNGRGFSLSSSEEVANKIMDRIKASGVGVQGIANYNRNYKSLKVLLDVLSNSAFGINKKDLQALLKKLNTEEVVIEVNSFIQIIKNRRKWREDFEVELKTIRNSYNELKKITKEKIEKNNQTIKKDLPIFEGIPNPFTVPEVHSWAVSPVSLPEDYEITSESTYIQTIKSKTKFLYGEQFHAEIKTDYNQATLYLVNFLKMALRERQIGDLGTGCLLPVPLPLSAE